jgi:hypothetical protein
MTDFVFQLKVEGMLAKGLQLRGWTPVALVPAGSRIARGYLGAFGVERFVELPDYLDAAGREEAELEAARLLEGEPSLAELKELTFHGAAIGRNVLSTVSRALHEGAVDPADPAARRALAEILPLALRSTLAAEALVRDLEPGLVMFLERNYAAEAPVSEVALVHDLNVIQFVSGLSDDSLVFKRFTPETRRAHPRSLSDESWARVRAMRWNGERDRAVEEDFRHRYDGGSVLTRRIQGWTSDRGRHEVLGALGLDPGKKTAVVYSHILWDANMFYGDDLFADQEEWFVETVRAACENDRVNWIVKLHPANVWKLRRDGVEGELDEEVAIREAVGELPPHVALLRPDSEVSTRSVFELTDYGITIRGSVGFELPCFGVPVLTAGTGFYAGRGFTVDSATAAEYLARLRSIEAIPPLSSGQVELARRHAYALFRLRPLRFASFEATMRPLGQAGHPLEHDVAIKIRSRSEVERAEDLRRFAAWAVDSRELDFLEPG